jgi:membrane-associated phospholipid phosphatase
MQPDPPASFTARDLVYRRGMTSSVRRWGRWILVVVLLLVGSAWWVDLSLAVWLQQNVTPGVDHVFQQVGRLGNSGMYVGAALTVYVGSLSAVARGWAGPTRGGYASWTRGSLLLLATLMVGGLITLILKKTVARARPQAFFDNGIYGLGAPFCGKPFDSFPSSHTFTAFAVAAVIGVIRPAWRWPAMALAGMVAVSRLVNLNHYLSDVGAAALIAIVTAHILAPHIWNEGQIWAVQPPWRWFKWG